jgi:hypothetical protein
VRGAAEIAAGLSEAPALRVAIALGGFGQLFGVLLFVANMWWRVRMPVTSPPPR